MCRPRLPRILTVRLNFAAPDSDYRNSEDERKRIGAMQFIQLLTTFSGRISRSQWWLGFIAVIIISLTGYLAINPQIYSTPVDQPLPQPGLGEILFGLLMMIPATAITVKRFNDRDWPWWLGYALGLIGVVFTAAPYFGYLVDPLYFSTPEYVFGGLFLLLALAALVDNGFLKGTAGPNRYGPDPLAGR